MRGGAIDAMDNIRAVFARADETDLSEGLVAYVRYREMMQRLAERFGYALEVVTAVFCALSPNNDYLGNLRSTVTLLEAHKEGRRFNEVRISTYRACGERAWSYLDGEDFWSTTKGPKIRSFYRNILDPTDSYYVTIDGHMVSIWLGRRLRMKQAAISRFSYAKLAHDFRAVAFENFIRPSQLQSILWFTWKRINRIVYDGQRELFNPDAADDLWKICRPIEEIKPFIYVGQKP